MGSQNSILLRKKARRKNKFSKNRFLDEGDLSEEEIVTITQEIAEGGGDTFDVDTESW